MFLYFVEGLVSLPRTSVADVELSHALDGTEWTARQVMSGPDGAAGVVACATEARCSYDRQAQSWQPMSEANGRRRWLGWWNDTPPTPETLARKEQIRGELVRMADEREWLVPIGLDVGEHGVRSRLPSVVRRTADKRWVVGDVLPRYRRLWQATQTLFDAVVDSAETGFMRFNFDQAVEVLSANYRVGPEEVSTLGLFDSAGDAYLKLVATVIDRKGTEALEKKAPAPAG